MLTRSCAGCIIRRGGRRRGLSKLGRLARARTLIAMSVLAGVVSFTQAATAKATASDQTSATGSSIDWPQYLNGPQHSSVSATIAFTVSNAASATQAWHWPPAGQTVPTLNASPTVVGGKVYIGDQNSHFWALDESTGHKVWEDALDPPEPATTCHFQRGISSTAAVLPDPVTGTSTVYVSGPRYLWALNAATGAEVWKTRIGPKAPLDTYYNWSSPTVAGGHIYVGLASDCDNPLIRGGVVELDQHSGHVLHTWYSVPQGSIGASVWSSVAATSNGSDTWVSTGNECDPTMNSCPSGNQIGNSLSIVHLSGSLCANQQTTCTGVLQAWQVPGVTGHDSDFGSSPTLFGSASPPPEVGACNKNGNYYALTANPLGTAPLWASTIGDTAGVHNSCLASAVWDVQTGQMYIGGNTTTIGGTTYGGSVRQVDPSTGHFIWQTGLPCPVMGTPC